MKQFHHIGLPVDEVQTGEVFVADTKVWVTDPRKHPYRVEYLRFQPDSPVKGPLRDMPHVAYRVDNLQEAIQGENLLLPPFHPTPNLTVAFLMKDGAVVEYMQFEKESDLPWG